MLLGLIVAIFIILLVLGVAASEAAFSLRREREVESARRANQYVRAIRVFYRKLGHYPGSMQQLENTNNVRYLRQDYIDPLTGKNDWRVIAVGQNKTTVKGFFGQPLAGIASQGLGALAGSQSTGNGFPGGAVGPGGVGGPGGAATGVGGSTATTGAAGSTDASGAAGTSGTAGGANGQPGAAGGTGSTLGGGLGGQNGSGPFMGVGSSANGPSIIAPNQQTTYQTWEFLYDPRIEQLIVAGQMNGGGVGSAAAGSLGQTPGAAAGGFGAPGGNVGGGFGGTSTTGAAGGAGQGGGTAPTQP
jgi:type II secretory pathway pseudopilin PulG